MRFPSFLCVVLFAASAQAQNSPCDQIDAAKKKTYGYKPAELTDAARKPKSDEIDLFWKPVKAQRVEGNDCLKQLLSTEKDDGFFLFDGAKLLYSLESAQAPVIADAVLRADISQVNAAVCNICITHYKRAPLLE
jgi:hypothetical protein